MENLTEEITEEKEPKESNGYVGYPSESIVDCLEWVKIIASKYGTTTPVPKKDLSILFGKSESTMTMRLSSCGHYGLLKNIPKKGYIVTQLYQDYMSPIYPEDQIREKFKMFKFPELYRKIVEQLNGKLLPDESGFANLLKSNYGVVEKSTKNASAIFFENARSLGLIDANNKLRFLMPNESEQNKSGEHREKPKVENPNTGGELPPVNKDLIIIPILLPGVDEGHIAFPRNYTPENLELFLAVTTAYINAYKPKLKSE